jgi:hypothetical protein
MKYERGKLYEVGGKKEQGAFMWVDKTSSDFQLRQERK